MDLNLDPHYFEHRKAARLRALLGPYSDVLPIRLWAYAARQHPYSGSLSGYSMIEIEHVIAWRGPREKACKALIECGFIDRVENGFQVHDWTEHEGHLKEFHEREEKAGAA